MPREKRIQRARFAVEGATSGEPKASAMDKPLVGIVMGSTSDLETMRSAATMLQELGVPFELKVVSAHRTPDLMFRYAAEAKGRGLRAIIAGAGGAANAALYAARILALTDDALAQKLDERTARIAREVEATVL